MRIIQVGNSFPRMSIMNQFNNNNNNNNSSHSSHPGSNPEDNDDDDSEEEFGTEDSDEEPEEEDDDEESDGCTTQALAEHVESSFLLLLDQTVEKVEKSYDIHRPPSIVTSSKKQQQQQQLVTSHQFPSQTAPVKLSRDEETQTDDSFAPEDVINGAVAQGADVRHEIASLRLSRDTLVNQRKEVADRIKEGASEDQRADEKKVYEYEEAIEAIDSVIEFKNEVICGRECILSSTFAPGRTEADLVTRLSNMTTLDLQRLLWKYFSKVVELRYSSKRLEKQLDELETECERLSMNLNRSSKYMKDMRSEYESRIKLLIGMYSKDQHSALPQFFTHQQTKLESAYKKVQDYEKAIFQLLVRHGYLTNTQDCDVQQVLQRLHVDTSHLGFSSRRHESKSSSSKRRGEHHMNPVGEIPSQIRHALASEMSQFGGMSRRMREAYGNRHHRNQQTSSSRHHNHHHHHHHNGQSNHHRDRDHHHVASFDPPDFHHSPQQTAEVKRTSKKLIIQNRPTTPDPT